MDLSWQRVGTWRTKSGNMVDTHEADKVWRRGQAHSKADTRRTHGGHTADTRRTHGGQSAETRPKRNQGGQWRTHGGQAPGTRPEHIAASPFSSKREPHSKLFGEKYQSTLEHQVTLAAFRLLMVLALLAVWPTLAKLALVVWLAVCPELLEGPQLELKVWDFWIESAVTLENAIWFGLLKKSLQRKQAIWEQAEINFQTGEPKCKSKELHSNRKKDCLSLGKLCLRFASYIDPSQALLLWIVDVLSLSRELRVSPFTSSRSPRKTIQAEKRYEESNSL